MRNCNAWRFGSACTCADTPHSCHKPRYFCCKRTSCCNFLQASTPWGPPSRPHVWHKRFCYLGSCHFPLGPHWQPLGYYCGLSVRRTVCMGVLSRCVFVTVAPGPAIGIYIGLLCSSLWLYSSSTGLRLMLLGLGIVLSTMQCLFDTLGSRGLRWFSDSFTPGLTL